MAHVTALLRRDGWAVADRHSERPGPGYDLEAREGFSSTLRSKESGAQRQALV